jgi:hypothetical protein
MPDLQERKAGSLVPSARTSRSLPCFKTRDEKALAEICEEVASDIEPDTFLRAYRFATDEPHSFLLVDFSPKHG